MALNDNVTECGTYHSLIELMASAIGKDATGKATLRVIDSNAVAGSRFFDCSNGVTPQDLEAAFKALFAFDSNGDIALRVSLP